MSSEDTSASASRESSSADLKKKVHFNRDENKSDLDVEVKRFEQDTTETQAIDLDAVSARVARMKGKGAMRPHTQPHDSSNSSSLFFLPEEEDESNVVSLPAAPFKKTGKIKISQKPVSPLVQPVLARDVDPFATPNASTGSLKEYFGKVKLGDIPMINLQVPTSVDKEKSEGTTQQGQQHDNASLDVTQYIHQLPSSVPASPGEEKGLMFSDEHKKLNMEAYKLVRAHTVLEDKKRQETTDSRRSSFMSTNGSERSEIIVDQLEPAELGIRLKHAKGGVLSNLMQLYNSTVYQEQPSKPSSSGTSTPKWHQRHSHSQTSLVALLGAGQSMSSIGMHSANTSQTSLSENLPRPEGGGRKHSGGILGSVFNSSQRPRIDTELRITIAIADVLQRQRFVVKLCRALMLYGAPTHRLEEYLKMTSRAVELEAQFLYIPGCMIVAFDDRSTHTSDVRIVRVTQGVDLGKLNEVHTTYKNVLHGVLNVDNGINELEYQMNSPQLYKLGLTLFAYGLASVAVGPFAFNSSFIDLPIQFLLGLIVGFMQIVVAARSSLHTNVMEILATILVSFIARGFGSIPRSGGDGTVFCFSALTQSAIALILPGYMVLCGALELQSKSIVAGSVRLVYAVIFSLFLSFGVTIGSVLYGWIDVNATTATTCSSDISDWWRILFVPLFTLMLCIVNQARPRQIPVALFISSAGYLTNYFTYKRFGAAQVSNSIASFVIGCLGNLYSRIGHGLAFTAVLPSIFVQVPSGLASGSSLVSGLELANSILNATANATYGSATIATSGAGALQFGYAMITIAIGISVGLFLSALLIYIPFFVNEKRTGLLTF